MDERFSRPEISRTGRAGQRSGDWFAQCHARAYSLGFATSAAEDDQATRQAGGVALALQSGRLGGAGGMLGRLPGVPGRFPHDMRRSAVKVMIERGVPERVAMDLVAMRTRSIRDGHRVVVNADLANAAARLSKRPGKSVCVGTGRGGQSVAVLSGVVFEGEGGEATPYGLWAVVRGVPVNS